MLPGWLGGESPSQYRLEDRGLGPVDRPRSGSRRPKAWSPPVNPRHMRLVEAYFVRMVSVYAAIATVEHRPTLSEPTSSLLGACMLRILDALPQDCREEMHSAVPEDAGHFHDRYLPGRHTAELGWALKKLGFDIVDTPLQDDIERRVQFCEQQRFSATGELPPVNLAGRHYPAFNHLPRDRERGSLSELQGFRPKQLPPRITAVRVRLDESSPADTGDPLGRTHIGYSSDLTPQELWERGRGVWKFRADHVAASTIVLMVHDKTVVLVASITGLTLHRGGLAILGEPLTDHPLIGKPDPLHTPNPLVPWGSAPESERKCRCMSRSDAAFPDISVGDMRGSRRRAGSRRRCYGGAVERGHQFAVGHAGGVEIIVLLAELPAQFHDLLLECGVAAVKFLDVVGAAESGLTPCLVAEDLGEPVAKLHVLSHESIDVVVCAREISDQGGATDRRSCGR
ncbi:hypothetical protein [Rhodococcus sp. IEGM 1307]|uniref:hypothetical protein n=1 Tax=Rhodococcus sp. IEGM 1307 TaxID=3047091 RepID=UPI0024B805A0|nr:hypothetical protein [Rhodococcus sp. IEGM 1307]MDI9980118.1 hypothetical protein [Rhodococcus sp. IEGM 1307]